MLICVFLLKLYCEIFWIWSCKQAQKRSCQSRQLKWGETSAVPSHHSLGRVCRASAVNALNKPACQHGLEWRRHQHLTGRGMWHLHRAAGQGSTATSCLSPSLYTTVLSVSGSSLLEVMKLNSLLSSPGCFFFLDPLCCFFCVFQMVQRCWLVW